MRAPQKMRERTVARYGRKHLRTVVPSSVCRTAQRPPAWLTLTLKRGFEDSGANDSDFRSFTLETSFEDSLIGINKCRWRKPRPERPARCEGLRALAHAGTSSMRVLCPVGRGGALSRPGGTGRLKGADYLGFQSLVPVSRRFQIQRLPPLGGLFDSFSSS